VSISWTRERAGGSGGATLIVRVIPGVATREFDSNAYELVSSSYRGFTMRLHRTSVTVMDDLDVASAVRMGALHVACYLGNTSRRSPRSSQ